MGDYRITIEGVGTHHSDAPHAADTKARELAEALRAAGHQVNLAKLEALEYEGAGGTWQKTDQLPVVVLQPINRGDAVIYRHKEGETWVERPAIVSSVWSPHCINVWCDGVVHGSVPLRTEESDAKGWASFEPK